jgi:hypothetical protein
LPIARIGLQGATTIVEQTLPDEKIVRLTVTDAAAEPEASRKIASEARPSERARAARPQAAAAPQTQNVAVTRGGKSITITGELPADSLRALARKIR